jgi:hypothetical protein
MNQWDEDNARFAGVMFGLVVVWVLFYIFLALPKAHAQAIMGVNLDGTVIYAQPNGNLVYVDQIGSNNTVIIGQDGSVHSAQVVMGKDSPVDNTYIAITQQGTGTKTAKVEIPMGINNSIAINQDGVGNHHAGIQNLSGTANNVTVNQTGAGNHTLAIAGGVGSTNSGNTITAEQSGGVGADKSFQLNLNGTSGATVNVQQTNPTGSNTGSMTIQCVTCGTYNYTRQ